MSVDIEKICRTCLALNGPLLSIYNDSATKGDTIADMLKDFTKMKPEMSDNMPQKVCLTCISEINRCYSFKMKCENSNRTLRQLLPDAKPEENDIINVKKDSAIPPLSSKSVQTTPEREILKRTIPVQTSPIRIDQIPENKTPTRTKENTTNQDTPPTVEFHRKTRKRLFDTTVETETGNSLKTYKKKITESYNIESTDFDGIQFILKLDSEQRKNSTAENTDEQTGVLVKGDNGAETYEITTNDNYECDEYEIDDIETVVDGGEEEQITVESDDVIFVKTGITDVQNLQKNFVIIQSIEAPTKSSQNISEISSSNVRKEYGCTECVMTFYSLKVLRRHMNKHHGLVLDTELDELKYRAIEKEVKSEKPPNVPPAMDAAQSSTATKLDSEIRSNDSTPVLKYICNKCNSSFSSQRALKYHKTRNICNSTSYECGQCERVFTSMENLESHIASHEKDGQVCNDCDKIFTSNEELANHQISVHNRSVRNQCNICKKVFTMLSTLRDHLRTHSGEKPFHCEICGKSFSQSANLKQHLQRHENDKKFKCDECSKSYVTKAELFSHKRSHNGDHPYKCDGCSATFTTSSSLVKHRRRHTGERPYACDICPMRFAVLNVLKNHRRLHTGEKPYKCPHCDKRFTQKGDCMIHASKHNENSTYVCNCGKNFKSATQFQQHMKRSHPELLNDQTKVLKNDAATKEIVYFIDQSSDGQNKANEEVDLIEVNLAKICGQSSESQKE